MPELPEVEAVVRGLKADGLEGARLRQLQVHRVSSIRPQSVDELSVVTNNQRVTAIERRAKNILLHLSNGYVIRIHLRMTGDLRISTDSAHSDAAVRVEWALPRKRRLLFADGRALGKVHAYTEEQMSALLSDLGPEPFSHAFTSAALLKAAQKSGLPAKLFLMDQTKVAGLGNIYVAEALFRAHISPLTPMRAIEPPRMTLLHAAIRVVLRSAIQSVYKAYRSPGGYRNHRDDFVRAVYGRAGKPCPLCGADIRCIRQGGRSTYFCGQCQPEQ